MSYHAMLLPSNHETGEQNIHVTVIRAPGQMQSHQTAPESLLFHACCVMLYISICCMHTATNIIYACKGLLSS